MNCIQKSEKETPIDATKGNNVVHYYDAVIGSFNTIICDKDLTLFTFCRLSMIQLYFVCLLQ